MKKIAYFIATIYMLVNITACVDLDTAPYSEATGNNMWSTESLVEMGVTGVYNSVKKPIYSTSMVGAGLWVGYYGLDVLGMSGSSRLGMNSLFTSNVNPGNSYFSNMWKWCYDGVHRANAAIVNIPLASMDEGKKAKRVAEMKILRAFFYGRLNEVFGNTGLGVPLYLKPVAATEAYLSQSPESEVWKQIIADLTDAINEPNLPNKDTAKEGRVSKGVAYALRGRAYLITKEYDKAAADYTKVGECGYKLFTDAGAQSYKMLFKQANEQCDEMIFSIQYIEEPTKAYGSTLQKYVAAFQQGSLDSRGCWTDIRIAPAVVELYESVDPVTGAVSDFKWSNYLPEWDNLSVEDRKVFFLRDKMLNGTVINSAVTNVVDGSVGLGSVSSAAKALYLQEGNEGRIKKAYANRDPRLTFNVVTPYSEFRGVNSNSTAEGTYVYRFPVVNKAYFDQSTSDGKYRDGYTPSGSANAEKELVYIHRKFVGEGLEFAYRESNPIDEPIIRYADVLLQWAEALVEKNDLAGAKAKVKMVRDRAGINTPDAPFTNQTTARNYVRDERRREFVGEGINFFDEMRWRTLKETKFDRKQVEQVYGGKVSTGGTYEWIGDHWYTWPVPKTEIEMNPNLTKTPGWIYE
ncbi:MAG: RagB/SusD family nutrient uptake outer membrane protein [Prevotella sp.]|nr:RagB/SusD family nutrient uptake outer membrane protein [Prevotella sp.]